MTRLEAGIMKLICVALALVTVTVILTLAYVPPRCAPTSGPGVGICHLMNAEWEARRPRS